MLRRKDFGLAFAAVILTIIGLLQLLRIVLQWDVSVNGHSVPFAVSWAAFALAWLSAGWLFLLIMHPGSGSAGP